MRIDTKQISATFRRRHQNRSKTRVWKRGRPLIALKWWTASGATAAEKGGQIDHGWKGQLEKTPTAKRALGSTTTDWSPREGERKKSARGDRESASQHRQEGKAIAGLKDPDHMR